MPQAPAEQTPLYAATGISRIAPAHLRCADGATLADDRFHGPANQDRAIGLATLRSSSCRGH
jgi:hypothetical protein